MLILQPIDGLRIVCAPISMPSSPPPPPALRNLADSALSPRVLESLGVISSQLKGAEIRHAVIGALAIGVYGWPRATRDIDLLVGDEAWHRLSTGERRPIVPLPEQVGGVGVDYLPVDVAGDFLNSALDHPFVTDGIPIAPPEVVVCTKLLRLAMREQADIVELVKAGHIDRAAIRRYLDEHAPMLTGRWDALVIQADVELRRA